MKKNGIFFGKAAHSFGVEPSGEDGNSGAGGHFDRIPIPPQPTLSARRSTAGTATPPGPHSQRFQEDPPLPHSSMVMHRYGTVVLGGLRSWTPPKGCRKHLLTRSPCQSAFCQSAGNVMRPRVAPRVMRARRFSFPSDRLHGRIPLMPARSARIRPCTPRPDRPGRFPASRGLRRTMMHYYGFRYYDAVSGGGRAKTPSGRGAG